MALDSFKKSTGFVGNKRLHSQRLLRLCTIFAVASSCSFAQLSLSGFIQCVGSSGTASTCELEAGTFYIADPNHPATGCPNSTGVATSPSNTACGPIQISRSNITVEGASTTTTILTRVTGDPSCSGSACTLPDIIDVGTTGGTALEGVIITNMTINGDSGGDYTPPTTPGPYQTTCLGITYGCGGTVTDLAVKSVNANGTWPTSTPGEGLTIRGVQFYDAPGNAISMENAPVADIWIYQNGFVNATTAGITADNNPNGITWDTGNNGTSGCDEVSGWRTASEDQLPRRILIQDNNFDDTDTGAISLDVINSQIDGNSFSHDYQNPVSGESEGGSLVIFQCADTVSITGNSFHGLDDTNADKTRITPALELYGRNITITTGTSGTTNTFTNFSVAAIEANSTLNLTINDANVTNSCEAYTVSTSNICSGINIQNEPSLRSTTGLTITNTTSTNSASSAQANGINIQNNGGSSDFGTITINSSNSLSGNRVGDLCINSNVTQDPAGSFSIAFSSTCPSGDPLQE